MFQDILTKMLKQIKQGRTYSVDDHSQMCWSWWCFKLFNGQMNDCRMRQQALRHIWPGCGDSKHKYQWQGFRVKTLKIGTVVSQNAHSSLFAVEDTSPIKRLHLTHNEKLSTAHYLRTSKWIVYLSFTQPAH